jgi:hypothetical protein
MTYFGGSQSREAVKTGIIFKKQYIPQLADERMDLYSSVNLDRGIYGHVTGMERGVPIYSSVKGASQYISQLHITKEYICRLGVTYIHRRYIPQLFHRLIKKYNVYSLVMKACSSVITDERVCISCSVGQTYGCCC